MSFDLCAWIAVFAVSAWLRVDLIAGNVPWAHDLALGAATGLIFVTLAVPTKLHQGRAPTGSLEEMLLLGMCVVGAGAISFALNLGFHWVPRSVPASSTVAALVLMAWVRVLWRRMREMESERTDHTGTSVLVVGAGEGGRDLVNSMLRDPGQTWSPVGFLDDDPHKRHRRIRRIPVLGGTDTLVEQVAATGAEAVIVAIPSAGRDLISRLRLDAAKAEVPVKVLPSPHELLNHDAGIRDLRDINLSDVLGRHQIDTDLSTIADYLSGRRVLVTGAGGSIGSELCRQIGRYGPAELIMLDRDESALHAVQLSIQGRALLDSDEVVLCDIRDRDTLLALFKERRPEVVFHAAALKHLPMLEQYPAEAVKTNIVGTQNVLDAAELVGSERVVNISTDKAANPSSVLGYSKRVAERITANRAQRTGHHFVSVRFGNVLGSRGSVLTAFASQIATGGPVTVTHPDVTRYFMTIEEACELVVQAAAIGRPGEALVLDMGNPVRIQDMARQLIAQNGRPLEVVYTGLRPGEKLHEELFGD
ncbi:MAG: polysaccharide biosynthesis protein, partial [Nocardioides sp.]